MSNRTVRRRVVVLLTISAGLLLQVATGAEEPKAPAPAPPAPAPPPAAPPLQLSDLRVPEGFVVERVAGPPLVEHPMMAGFDERGRLFIAENAGVNLPFKELLADPPSKILMLEDADGDGTFDKRTVFADKLTFPSGALWHRGALYVCSPPGLWRFDDLDDDGVSDRRTELVTGFGSTGNAADLHGPYLGPEGWLYFCDGRNGHDVTLGDGTQWKGRAACMYRCRIDGTGLEVVFGGGFDNPVEVAFTPEGEPLVNVNIVNAQPHRVDAILYGIEGGNYPYEPAWQELKRTGDFLPSVGDLGWVATSGFMRYRGTSLGDKYVGRYFSTEFNPHRVRSHVVERDGAGFRVTHEDFLTCDHPDFHPTDVLEDADGSLLVIDTGGWFRIGCPQSQIAKPDVKGGIYRVRRSDAAPSASPEHTPPVPNEALAAIRLASLARDPAALAALNSGLASADPAIRRESAIGLGRLRVRAAVNPLLVASATAGGDRFLEHAILFALLSIADREATLAGLRHEDGAVRRAALIALDQMEGPGLTAELVVPHLASGDPALRQAALSIATARPEWAGQMVGPIRAVLAKPAFEPGERESLRAAIVAFASADPIRAVVADVLGADATTDDARLLLLQAITEAAVTPLPEAWVEPLRKALGGGNERLIVQAVEAVRASRAEQFRDELTHLARDTARPAELRVAALSAALPAMTSMEPADFQLLLGELAPDRAPLARLAAAQALAIAALDDARLGELAGVLREAGPLELPTLLLPFERSANAAIGQALVRALASASALTSLTPAGLTQALAKYPAEVRESAAPLLAKINPDADAQRARLAELEPLLSGGDPSRGQSVFFGKTAACATCHAVKGAGATIGPDLTTIGSIRAGRDLLESLVFPSSSFARGYESFIVQTTANEVLAGTLAGESAGSLVLRTPAEVRVPRASVKSIRPDKLSIMPQGLDEQLSRQELADLLAFLQSLK